MKDDNYINIQGWMINELGLTSNELLVYAIIYGFTQDGVSEYKGGNGYLMKCLKCAKNTVKNNLNSLIKKGLLSKRETVFNGNFFVAFRTPKPIEESDNDPGQKLTPPGSETDTPPGQNMPPPGSKIDPSNTTSISIKGILDGSYTLPSNFTGFDFKKILIELGAEKSHVEDWMLVRSKKKAVNTKTSLNYILSQCDKGGINVGVAAMTAAQEGWSGFKYKWYKNLLNDNSNGDTNPGFGTNR